MKNWNLQKSKKAGFARFVLYMFLIVLPGIGCSKSQKPEQKVSELAIQEVSQVEYKVPPPPGAENWPSFRGVQAKGIAGGQDIPLNWDVEKGTNIKWKMKIPGLGHSSPVIWKDKVFITTAVSKDAEPYLKVGRYGESPDNPEKFRHHYKIYCIDKNIGKTIWEKIAHSGIPKVKRHIKSSHANPTIATDGKHIIAFFGSEGLYCYNMDGKLFWKKDLGYLDAGAFDAPEIQWGFGSSPTLYKDKLIVLCDVNNQSFIAAFEVATGKELWRTLRDEVPTWGTPTVSETKDRVQVIVNGYKHIGSYDVETGKELWRLTGGGDVPIPTPVVAHDLVFITNAHGKLKPIYAIKLDAKGDISLKKGEKSNEFVAWFKPRRGAYQPTPIVYGDYLYVGTNSGVLTCYKAKTGEQVYRERIAGRRSAYTASPAAADGRLYYSDEYGNIHIIKAGPKYAHLATNKMGESCLASPAISGQMLFIRTNKHLFAISRGGKIPAITKVAQVQPDTEKKVDSPFEPSKPVGKLTDPVEILKLADAAAKAVNTVKYYIEIEPTGFFKARFALLKINVIANGSLDGYPERFLMNGELREPGSDSYRKFTFGSDGNEYFIIDHDKKTAKVDIEIGGIAGPLVGNARIGIIREFHTDEPYTDELKSDKKIFKGIKKINGEDCYEIYLVYTPKGDRKASYYFSIKNFHMRGLIFTMLQKGQKGELLVNISNLVLKPKVDLEIFKFKLPKNYTKKDD